MDKRRDSLLYRRSSSGRLRFITAGNALNLLTATANMNSTGDLIFARTDSTVSNPASHQSVKASVEEISTGHTGQDALVAVLFAPSSPVSGGCASRASTSAVSSPKANREPASSNLSNSSRPLVTGLTLPILLTPQRGSVGSIRLSVSTVSGATSPVSSTLPSPSSQSSLQSLGGKNGSFLWPHANRFPVSLANLCGTDEFFVERGADYRRRHPGKLDNYYDLFIEKYQQHMTKSREKLTPQGQAFYDNCMKTFHSTIEEARKECPVKFAAMEIQLQAFASYWNKALAKTFLDFGYSDLSPGDHLVLVKSADTSNRVVFSDIDLARVIGGTYLLDSLVHMFMAIIH